jgi:hypothetical protein
MINSMRLVLLVLFLIVSVCGYADEKTTIKLLTPQGQVKQRIEVRSPNVYLISPQGQKIRMGRLSSQPIRK